jgi:hypothetical protein
MQEKKWGCLLSFEDFWEAYPRHVGRKVAERKWNRMSETEKRAAMAGLAAWKLTEQWQKDGGMWIPYASTFLNQERYLDDPQPHPASYGTLYERINSQPVRVKPEALERIRQRQQH